MQVAILNNSQVEPIKGQLGFCPKCGSKMIAKCGKRISPYWAHQEKKQCDYWQKADSSWKNQWKSYFPVSWRRPIKYDADNPFNGNVDLQTPSGMYIILQEAEITLEQIETIEILYSPLIWIVNYEDNDADWEKLILGKELLISQEGKSGVFEIAKPELLLPIKWINRSSVVAFDYFGDDDSTTTDVILVYPNKLKNNYMCNIVPRLVFVDGLKKQPVL